MEIHSEDTEKDRDRFEKELAELINKYSYENMGNVPDFIMARYLHVCLKNFAASVIMRDNWYSVHLSPGKSRFLNN